MQADIKAGQQDLYQACRQSLAHGVLLLLHYLAPLIPWQDAAVDAGQAAALRPWLQGLLQLLEQATELVLQPLSKPQESNIGEHAHLVPPSQPPDTPLSPLVSSQGGAGVMRSLGSSQGQPPLLFPCQHATMQNKELNRSKVKRQKGRKE